MSNFDLKDVFEIFQELQGKINDELGINYSMCLAGGAPRDLLLEKPVKDVDFFIKKPAAADKWMRLGRVLRELGYDVIGEEYEHTNFLTFDNMNGRQVMVCNDSINNVLREEFDFAICQIFINTIGEMWAHQQFLIDVEDEYHTVWAENGKLLEVNNDHLRRIQAKYPWPTRAVNRELSKKGRWVRI